MRGFQCEARNSAALNHPAIVSSYDAGEIDSDYGRLHYIVMEYVDGRTPHDLVLLRHATCLCPACRAD